MSDAVTRARELLDKATPGPWVADGLGGNLDAPSGRVAEVLSWSDADAELIAAAPTLLAELADEVDLMQGEVQRMRPFAIAACECPNDDDPDGCYCPDGFTHDDCPMGHGGSHD